MTGNPARGDRFTPPTLSTDVVVDGLKFNRDDYYAAMAMIEKHGLDPARFWRDALREHVKTEADRLG